MSTYFTIKDTLFDITEKYPETIAVFTANGFPQMEDDAQRSSFGKMLTLEMALKMKNQNVDAFSKLLDEQINNAKTQEDITLNEETSLSSEKKENTLSIAGLLPCPVRLPMLEAFNEFKTEYEATTGITLETELKAASSGVEWVAEHLDGVTDSKKLPDLFISAGFDLFFDKDKIGKFRDQGVFKDLLSWSDKKNKTFANYDLHDPKKIYSIISIVPAVFLVNTKELNGRDVPETWEALLSDEFENSVSLPVGDFDLFNAILLNIHDNYGDEGIEKLAKIMLDSMHPAQMVKSETSKKVRPAVTIMPYFFTKMTKEGGTMKAIWPKDGAIVSPIFMLAKKELENDLKPIVDFFASKQVGETLAHNGLFPSLHPEVDNRLPDDTPLMWLGWDKIMSNDLTKQIYRLEKLFNDTVSKGA